MGYLENMMERQGMSTKKKKPKPGTTKQCPGCQKYKKADNCIQCFHLEKTQRLELERKWAQHVKLLEDLKQIVAVTPYTRLREKAQERLLHENT